MTHKQTLNPLWKQKTLFFLILFLSFTCLPQGKTPLLGNETSTKDFTSSKQPVDVSFLVADLKYSEKRGVKICEVQNGIHSTFYGDRFSHGEPGIIPENFYHTLLQYQDKFWTTPYDIAESQIRMILKQAPEWTRKGSLNEIKKDPDFLHRASLPIYDPYNIHNYHGFLYTKLGQIGDYKAFHKKYPGIIVLDQSTFPFWVDKYKMTALFSKNETLSQYKPRWNLYPKKYSKNLANQIINDIQSDLFVIKPRGTFLGFGVIIVDRENLNDTLKYILKKSRKLKNDPDHSYSYWHGDRFDSFLVEEFVPSDPISVAHFENKIFQPTMRVAFLLIYNNQTIDLKILGGYWLLPYYSLSEGRTLNEKHKAYCKAPYFCKVDSDTMEKVKDQLEIALPLLYEQMLQEP